MPSSSLRRTQKADDRRPGGTDGLCDHPLPWRPAASPTDDVGDMAALSGADRAVAGGSVFADVSGTLADRGRPASGRACSLQESQRVANRLPLLLNALYGVAD